MKIMLFLFCMGWCILVNCTERSINVNYQVFVSRNSVIIEDIKEAHNLLTKDSSNFISLDNYKNIIGHSKVYWLYLKPRFTDSTSILVLSLNERFTKIVLYQYPLTKSKSLSGSAIPVDQKSLSGCSIMLDNAKSPFLVKIENPYQTLFMVNDISIQTIERYFYKQRMNMLLQGYAQGFLWLMLLYNLVLFLIVKKIAYLYYVLYIIFNAFFLLFTSGSSEAYLFSLRFGLSIALITFQLLGVFFYVLFIRTLMLRHCTTYNTKVDSFLLKPFAFTIIIVNASIGSLVFYRMDLFTIGSVVSNILSTMVGIIIFIHHYPKSTRFMRLIMIGSMILFLLGYVNVAYTLQYRQTELFYTLGLLIELLVLTYALNKQHFLEQGEIEFKNQHLTDELEIKNRNLVNMAMQLSSKGAVLALIKKKLENTGNLEKNKHLYNDIDLEGKASETLWRDFEKHFNETHPGFYRNLCENFPSLTTNELRLCAFLKLKLNTKEIAVITQRSAHSIETMRSRIRQKMDLGREESLAGILSHL